MTSVLRDVFLKVHEGYSVDRLICDPELNERFVGACRALGSSRSAAELNRSLMSLRKSGKLGVPTTKATRLNDEEYRFSSEMATRHLERRDEISLDEILIDPARAREFDSICESLCPGYSPLEYRWSALGLRKQRSLRPEVISHVVPAIGVFLHACNEISIAEIPTDGGLYIFFDESQTLYVGEASNLRARLKKHLDHSDNKQLARWFWTRGFEKIRLEIHLLEARCSTRVRRALELELIRTRKPAFNIQGAGDLDK